MMLLTPPTVVHPKKSPEAYKENEEVSAVFASQPSISENLTSRYASLQNLTAEEKKHDKESGSEYRTSDENTVNEESNRLLRI